MSKRAAVFSGQGAQTVGMGKDLAEAYPACADLFSRADEALGYSLSKVCFEGPEDVLRRTDRCQPAIFVVSVACYTALKQAVPDLAFAATGGLSLGEWSALHVAGVLSFEDTLRVLEARGRFMQEACEEHAGGMVSIIGLDSEALKRICEEAGVGISNMNSAAQTVLSGSKEGVAKAEILAKEAGAKRAVVLNVEGAYHSTLMSSAADRLAEVLADVTFLTPSMPVVSNAMGGPHGDADQMRENMVKQVVSTVRWYEGIEWMRDEGVSAYIECGPGKVLSGLIRRIDKEASVSNVSDVASLEKTVSACG